MFQVGEYTAVVIDQRLNKNKKDNLQLEFRCQLDGREEDKTIYLVLTEKTYEFTAELIVDVFQVAPQKWSDLDASDDTPKCDVRGRAVTLYCKHEQYEGELKERWSFSNPEMGRKPLDTNDKMTLDTLYGAAWAKAKLRLKKAEPSQAPAATAAAPVDQADIPF